MKIKVKVIPKSSQSYIEEDFEGNLRVKLKSLPVLGKANQELVEVFADYYNVPKGQIKIVKGLTSRDKIVEIS